MVPVIDINGLRVNYSDTGDGAPVVFVPGLAGSGEWFRYQSSGLSDQFRVITYDLRRARGAYTLDLLVDDLARFLLALRIYDAAVVGYSLGGLIAIKYALTYPERCPALVLCSTAPRFSDLPDAELAADLLGEGVRLPSFWERIWGRLRGSRPVSVDGDGPCGFLAGSASSVDSQTLHERLRLLRGTDLSALLGGVEAPTLVVASSGDAPYVLSGSQALQQAIPDATLEVTEGTDRFYFCTRHDLFNSTLAEWLAESISWF